MFLLFLFISYLIWRLRFLLKNNKWFILLISFTILLGNVKGMFISVNANFRLIMIMYCYLILEYRKDNDSVDAFFGLKNKLEV